MTHPNVLRVGYPLSFIAREDGNLLVPHDTKSVYHYYLLDNLAATLVRDSHESPSGYGSGLAQSWDRPSPRQWVLELRPGIAWSNGTAITPQEIAEHLRSLSSGKHRHVLHLRGLKNVSVDGRKIILEFREDTNQGLIHELSVADTGLVSPANLRGDWSVTSGAFFVQSFDNGKKVVLRRNPHFPSQHAYPDQVELTDYTMKNIDRFFDAEAVDLLKLPVPLFREPNQKVLSRASQKLTGYPTWIYFFRFNTNKSVWRDAAARRDLSALIDKALEGYALANLTRERQMIPEGYPGRIESVPSHSLRTNQRFSGMKLVINVLPSFAPAVSFQQRLKESLGHAGIEVAFKEGWDLGPEDREIDLQLHQFSGNQKDSMGSWQFMFTPEIGPLVFYRPLAEPLLHKVTANVDDGAREQALKDLHTLVLRDAFTIPLFAEPDVIAASKWVDLSHVNPFDMRLRLYEVRWK